MTAKLSLLMVALAASLICSACGGPAGVEADGDSDGDVATDADADPESLDDADTPSDSDLSADAEIPTDGDLPGDADLVNCPEIAAELRRALEAVTSCDEDHECTARDFDAPAILDCYTAVHGDGDTTEIEELAEMWRANGCDAREYRCEPYPPSEVVCTLTHRCRLMGEEYDQCAERRVAFRDEAERLNNCDDVTDCALVAVLDCGVMSACWIPIHYAADQTLLRQIERDYGTVHCPYATCSCSIPELACLENRCVEIYD